MSASGQSGQSGSWEFRSLREWLRRVPGVAVSQVPGMPGVGEQGAWDILQLTAASGGGLAVAVKTLPDFLRSRRSSLKVTVWSACFKGWSPCSVAYRSVRDGTGPPPIRTRGEISPSVIILASSGLSPPPPWPLRSPLDRTHTTRGKG
ncbi:effector-associated constant component EACC1 [Streptomyces nigrescens]|uniref:effector-associated constant component EACC1 n=1 Tax=Streptomyces nigrescens TaxID=1920 RepID=UPI0039659B04